MIPDSPDPSIEKYDSASDDETRRLLELELQKIRSEASAARLEARAAEIEMMMRRLRKSVAHRLDAGNEGTVESPASKVQKANESKVARVVPRVFASWDEVRSAQNSSGSRSLTRIGVDAGPSIAVLEKVSPDPGKLSIDSPSQTESAALLRFDGPHVGVGAPRIRDDESDSLHDDVSADPQVEDAVARSLDTESIAVVTSGIVTREPVKESFNANDAALADQLSESWEEDEDSEQVRRGKPAAWLVSAVVHVAVLLILAAIGLQTRTPKDQVAFSASTVSNEEVAMESFSIESVDEPEPQTEVAAPTPAETEYEISSIGEFKATDFSTDAVASPVSSMAAAMSSSSHSSAAPMSLKSDSASKMKFCGVEGGGNHFVYLVDSSGSMGDGFESARRELLASIDLLTPDQRFYVVFFDAQPDFMRITDPGKDETRSVYATAENKAALRRWAMRISKDRGRAPYDPLKFALGLKADVIFLLSDGEFPEGIPKLLKESNRIENLFGESKPISIVHTISYFSDEGASIMKRIASQNSGQYRYVPKP